MWFTDVTADSTNPVSSLAFGGPCNDGHFNLHLPKKVKECCSFKVDPHKLHGPIFKGPLFREKNTMLFIHFILIEWFMIL